MLGNRIESRMKELGIKTQTDLASRAEISPSYVHALIHGTRGKRLSVGVMKRLSKALRVPQKFFYDDPTNVENSLPGIPQQQTESQIAGAEAATG